MEGMELSRRYFFELALPLLRTHLPQIADRCAAGLCAGGLDAGCGSEVHGYDDALSRDHNWGPRFFLFLNEEDYAAYAPTVRAVLERGLPVEFEGYSIRATTAQATHFHVTTPRRNALAALGTRELPVTDAQWFAIPEAKLCEYSAGMVYHDPIGMVEPWKRRYAIYPHNVRCKRLAGAFFMAHAAGNALRCAQRGEWTSCRAYLDAAVGAAQRAAILLSGRYPPHVKWRARAFRDLPHLPEGWASAMERVALRLDPETLRNDITALLLPLGEMANASGLIEPQPILTENPFLSFNAYGFSAAFEGKVQGELAGRPLAIALDQMAEGYMPMTSQALEAHWLAGRPGISLLL